MVFGFFTLIVALLISAIAAYYSIVGLTTIFSSAIVPIIIMGAALEVGKITAAVWLKLNWHRANLTYKLYLVPAVAVLMLLTSMGIFGFLSKAHSDQTLITGDTSARVTIVDEKLKTQRDNIALARRALEQLDKQVDERLSRGTTEQGVERAAQLRRQQQTERARLQKDITAAQTEIARLNEERAPLAAAVRKVENEVGPIKYIAALIYGDNPDITLLEKAVRWVIIIIVAVFDPLALVLILAAQQSIRWSYEEKRRKANATVAPESDKKTESVTQDPSTKNNFNIKDHAYLDQQWQHFPTSNSIPMVAPTVESAVDETPKKKDV